ncbi:hypothetical protein CUB78_06675 [Prochlorococcus marinus str. XMU1401]|uniref:Mannitol dehydrogenase C-terminal domain-containing protein n=1 Tax=Prochlorococcus marinus str. XMU1401 TaxID=2052594 RepID=A0A8I1X5W1_PROMR|nr:hypothetical protein [Prochlorococcus marinus]MBO8223287.1 hypothetical protein [Prochlorococcus marinus str. XMU1401]MBW3059819.1 hypothetical protein [Prochlorococcus marinus str. XMU1401E]MCQ9198955.1 hypothetical protein [Prochlorococcus marinus XMU1429]PJC83633.1 hypothetical protein CUB78_06675 [Prochlorococcus marinus str. XMU1401]
MNKILIIGSGAIGRGYCPWIFNESIIDFVDSNTNLVDEMNKLKSYSTFMTIDNEYKEKKVVLNKVLSFHQINSSTLDQYNFVITCVGPRNFLKLTDLFTFSKTTVICFENDRSLVKTMRVSTNRSNIYFGIPDVISSNASNPNKENWPKLSLITENGKTYVEDGAKALGGDIVYVDENEIKKQWAAKLYIHNTPHCIAAYLGSLCRKTYLHEAMVEEKTRKIVEQATIEMKKMVEKEFKLEEDFTSFYAKKELNRFSNNLLFDPVLRVAREPFRKLGLNDRLIGAAKKAFANNIYPESILLGIMSAFLFDVSTDQDALISPLFNSMQPDDFLSVIIRLPRNDIIYDALLKKWNSRKELLMNLKNEIIASNN